MQALALLVLLAGHSRSEGRARFELDDTGRLDVSITLSELDMPELCDVDLSNRALRDERLRTLEGCLSRDVPRLVRVRADGADCPVLVGSVGAKNGTVAIDALASCPSFPERLVVDWGLFAATPLDHVAVATFSQPNAEPKLVMLSKRSSKLVVDVARPLWPKLAAALVAAVAAISLAAAGAFAIKRRRLARAPRKFEAGTS